MIENGFSSKIKNVVKMNMENDRFGVSELASELGLSRSQTFRKIKAITGKSANHFIREIRLEKAVELLDEGDQTVSEISYQVGFNSPSYFNKCFHDAYGITPGDYRNHNDTNTENDLKKSDSNKLRKVSIGKFSVFLALVIITFLSVILVSRNSKFSPKSNGISIAVLPLLDLSENRNMEYMAVGLTDAITLELSRIKDLRVISRGSTMIFQDSIIPYSEIANKLNVDLLLEGSVIFNADSLRVTVQLIEPFPNEKHLWANKYVQNSSNVIQLADDISTQIANEINIVVNKNNGETTSRKVNPKAFEYYLKGKFLWKNQNPESVTKAIDYLNRSIEIDSGFAPSYSALAECYIIMNKFIRNNEEKLKNKLESRMAINNALNKAITLDGSLAEAYITQGNILGKFDWNWEGMKEMASKGLRLNPNNPYGHILLSNYWAIKGDYKMALKEALKAENLDPLNPLTGSFVCEIYMLAGKYDEAIKKYNQELELFPNYGLAWNGIGIAYYLQDEKDKAKDSWIELHKIMGNNDMAEYFENANFNNSVNHWISEATSGSKLYCSNPAIIAMANLFVGRDQAALDYIENAYKYKNEDLPLIIINPVFKSLNKEPRFIDIASKVGVSLNF